jgi:hypothetical protein
VTVDDAMRWTDADQDQFERLATGYQLRRVARSCLGIDATGLTDQELARILGARVRRFAEIMRPTLEKLREAGVIPHA